MNTECALPTSLSEHAGNAESLSQMIQTSAKVKSCFVGSYTNWITIRFPSERAARNFQHAFESFAHASKRTVKRVRAKERAEMAMKRPGKITP